MKSLVTSLALGKIDGELVVDLSGIEDKAGDADLPIAVTWFNDEISLLQFDGEMDIKQFDKLLELSKKFAKEIYDMQIAALKSEYEAIQEDVDKQKNQNNSGDDK